MPIAQAVMSAEPPRILLVEDDVTFAAFMMERLRQLGYAAEWVKDGGRAEAHLRDRPCDLLIVDLALPDVEGLSLLAELKRGGLLGKAAVVVLTGRFSASDVERATRLGVEEYVAKPFNEDAFFGRLAELTSLSGGPSALLF